MKFTSRLIAVAVCAIALFGCQTDPTSTPIGGGEQTTLSISLEPTRTSLGEKGSAASSMQCLWLYFGVCNPG